MTEKKLFSHEVPGGVFSSNEAGNDCYRLNDTVGDFSFDGISQIKRIFEPNEFPFDPTFGFKDRTLGKKQIGLGENEAYLLSKINGKSLWDYSDGYDKLMMLNAVYGMTNRVVNGSIMQDDTFISFGGDEATLVGFFKEYRGIDFIYHKDWEELLPRIKDVFNGVIIFENKAEDLAEVSMLMYNIANVSGCLPVQKELYKSNLKAFADMPVVAFFKDGISLFSSLNYSTSVVLPLTSKTDAYCPSAKIDNNRYTKFNILFYKEAMQGSDIAFAKKMFIFNFPMHESLPFYKYFERIMVYLKCPAVIWGWVVSASEAPYTLWGHGMNEAASISNLSFYSTVGVKDKSIFPYKNPDKAKSFDKEKLYVAFSGESLDAGMFFMWQLRYYFYENRGKVKLNWGWPASFGRMCPSLMELYFSKATENDYFYNWGDSYVHTEAMTDSQLTTWQQETIKNSSAVMSSPKVEFSIGDQGFDKYPLRSENQPDIGLFYMTYSDECLFPIRAMNNSENSAKALYRGWGYNWRLFNPDFCIDKKPDAFARLDIRKAADYLLGLWNDRDEKGYMYNPIFTFFTVHLNETIDDYIALENLLDTDPKYKGKFEVVDFGELSDIARQISRIQLENSKTQLLKERDLNLAEMMKSGRIEVMTPPDESHNFVMDLLEDTGENTVVEKLENRIKLTNKLAEGCQDHLNTCKLVLPKGARYVVTDIGTHYNGAPSFLFYLTGNFGRNGEDSQVNLNGTSNDACNIRSGRIVFPLSESIYSYTDKGYPVTIFAEVNSKEGGDIYEINNLQFLSEKPLNIPVLRINGSCGQKVNDSFVENDIAYFPAEELFNRLGYKTTVSENVLTATGENKEIILCDLKSRNGKLYIAHTELINGLLPHDVWYFADKLELSINK